MSLYDDLQEPDLYGEPYYLGDGVYIYPSEPQDNKYYYVYRIDHIDWDDPEYYDTKEEAEEAIGRHHDCSMNPYYVNPIKLKKLKRKVK